MHSAGSTQSAYLNLASPSGTVERCSRPVTRKHDQIKISVSYPSSEAVSVPVTPTNFPAGLPTCPSSMSIQENAASIFGEKESRFNFAKIPETYSGTQSRDQSPKSNRKLGKRNLKIQVKKFRMETKAAKTLAIIVGGFVFCWFPFFTMYLVRAFCSECINDILFSILFWLGYCNSAVNPMIYALFSKDFRFAFKRIICRCFCSGKGVNPTTSRRGSEMSQLKLGGRTPSISPSAAAHSLGEDSDPLPENSDSR